MNAQNYISITSSVDEKPGCITDKAWQIQLSPSQERTVFQGTVSDFSHWVKNIGPDSLDAFVDVNVTGYGGPDEWWAYDMHSGDWPGKTNKTGENDIPARSRQMNELGRKCDTIWVNNINSFFGGTAESQDCVHVIDPEAIVPSRVEYEKGSGSVTVAGTNINVNNGGSCPVEPINIPYSWSIGGISSGPLSFNYGGVYGCNNLTNVISIPNSIKNQLNQKNPGPSGITYSITVNGETAPPGEINVYEVPFARFYGNDIYATNGDIKFNSYTNNPSHTYDGRGSVVQYAALASGSGVIDSAAYRWSSGLPIPQPNAPNGLDSMNSYLANTSSTSVYNSVINNLPSDCNTSVDHTLPVSTNKCVKLNDDTYFGGANIKILGNGDTHGAGDITYNKKITVVNDTNRMLMIIGNIVNTTADADYTDPSKAGVLLIVSDGDIVIDNNVQRIDAILVSKGNIYTCGFAGFGPGKKVSQDSIDEVCRNNLTINGSLSAKNIDFRRVGGSRYLNTGLGDTADGMVNCMAFRGIKNCGVRDDMPLNTGKTAEIINFPAYLYWATPYLEEQAGSSGTVDAMFVAPPRK